MIYKTDSIELRCGDWREVLADVTTCDAVITDPPYSERTHSGALSTTKETGIAYRPIDDFAMADLVEFIGERCSGWSVIHNDDETSIGFRRMLEVVERYTFALVPVLQHMPRVSGDGPGSPGHFLCVSRPRDKRFMSWGSLPCWYRSKRASAEIVRGAKPLDLMRAIIRDYTKPGDLIVDPYAGSGTTLLAAAIEGRRAIGAELDSKTYALAVKRLQCGYTRSMF